VLERFRRGRPEEPCPSEAEIEAGRYTIVLVPPGAAEVTGYHRTDVGLRMYRDGDWDHNPSDLDEAVQLIEQACGEPVTLVERHSDLTYWTARLRGLPAEAEREETEQATTSGDRAGQAG
jgi:hypothetical protein